MVDPEKATIGDLFRLMTEMRSDIADIKATQAVHTARFDTVGTQLTDAASEREAIRNVVDNDLAGQGQVMTLEGKITDVQRTTRQNGKKIDKLSDRMDRAGIPAE